MPHRYRRTTVNGSETKYIHRLIAQKKIGRELEGGEVVHHKDGNRYNNDPSNLEVLESHSLHMQLEHFARRYAGQELLLGLEENI